MMMAREGAISQVRKEKGKGGALEGRLPKKKCDSQSAFSLALQP